MNDHVLITGGSRGIGAATVLEFARAGYDVAFTWNSREDAALDVVQQAQALNPGGRFVALHADVSDSAQVNAAVQEALQQFGSLQALMCCAGIAQQKLFTDLTDEDCTGKELEHNLDEVHITANKNTVPGEKRSPFVTSGVRIGTPAVTTRGMGPDEMKVIADCIADCVFDFANKKDEVASKVEELTKKFPLYE